MRPLVFGLLLAICAAPLAYSQESFRVELGSDGETIADMRPVFMKFESRPMPAISPAEVVRRYQRLFDTSDEPQVRVDALNRLANIQQLSGHTAQLEDTQEIRRYREALGSYESIIQSGSFHGKLDELLYQMAKAHAYVGQGDQSIQRLSQLTGLYPESSLVPEARFRIAEAAFSGGNYTDAELEYGRLMSGDGGDRLKLKARYMQGWSQYKQGKNAWDRAAASFISVLDRELPNAASIKRVSASDVELIDDTLRVLALMAADSAGTGSLNDWLGGNEERHYDYLLFDRLADHYASLGRFDNSVSVSRAYVQASPDHPAAPAFFAQVIDVWTLAGRSDRVREARADYVLAYGSDHRYETLSDTHQLLWRILSRQLGDYFYAKGEQRSGDWFGQAAAYYEGLSQRTDEPGEILRLAGDARSQAGQYQRALESYRQAAYRSVGYGDAASAAWAAITIHRNSLDDRISFETSLQDLSLEAERFADRFPADPRLSGLNVNIANRWLEHQAYSEARRFARRTTSQTSASADERYSAWLVLGEVHTATGDHGLAEHAWQNAATLIREHTLRDVDGAEANEVLLQLAKSVYRQGEAAQQAGTTDAAVAHFQRVGSVLPGSEIAIKGLYDAANSLLVAKRWQAAIHELTRFRAEFPGHSLTVDISDKLVLAYTRSDQPVRAASELIANASMTEPHWPRQLRAAELFHQGGAVDRRNGIYQQFLAESKEAVSAAEHIEAQTMRQRLVASGVSPDRYRDQLVNTELASQWHSPDTLKWSASAAMALGRMSVRNFEAIALQYPLAESLARKQAALEQARQRFAEAIRLDRQTVQSEALYRRAELYRMLAADLMASEVPDELNDLEGAQYQMLLEEEAYPFEEKAIRLHARNHELLAEGEYTEWVGKSLEVLAELFPGRYDRDVRWMTWNEEANDDA
ncbi:MAG: tetratricopeptide repeat protein [Marinobacter sp.]